MISWPSRLLLWLLGIAYHDTEWIARREVAAAWEYMEAAVKSGEAYEGRDV